MKILISHSSKNKDFGNALVDLLRKIGVKEDEIIFTSNIAYGIPVGQNIFNWLKSQIENKPFVVYLLSKEYYESVVCLNEMGAAWIVENAHAAIFTPKFDLSSEKFQSGVLDPREIGFYINDEDRVLSFIQLLSKSFDITNSTVLISQSVKKFIKEINSIKPPIRGEKIIEKEQLTIDPQVLSSEKKVVTTNPFTPIFRTEDGLYSKFINGIRTKKLIENELILIHYIKTTGRAKLMTGWQEANEISNIKEWEKINEINNILSQNYSYVLKRFELRGFTEVSAVTSSNNPKEVKLKNELASIILDLPEDVVKIIDEAIENNFYKYTDERKTEIDFQF